MSDRTSASSTAAPVEFRRHYAAPISLVFAAWTEPERMKHWLHPAPDWVNPSIEVDLRIGGRYRIAFHHPETDERAAVAGDFRELRPPTRLAYTWTWEPPNEHAGIETLVTVDFTEVDGGTTIHLTQVRFADDTMRDRHAAGWEGAFNCLSLYMSRGDQRGSQ